MFQKAATALCMPRRPAVPASEGEPGCWIMVLLAMNLYEGCLDSPALVFSMRDWRMVFCAERLEDEGCEGGLWGRCRVSRVRKGWR